jgi:putative glutamine amidotransferase
MRVANAVEYWEPRDALARDWGEFLAFALPEVAWLPLPNLGSGAVDYARRWGVDALLLTGGNDLGESPQRDETESALVEHALAEHLSVFGVCRGLQVLQTHFRGELRRCAAVEHVATRHPVRFEVGLGGAVGAGDVATVNSFHAFGVRADEVAPPLAAFAVTDDGWTEGLYWPGHAVAAVMWHPERDRPFRDYDRRLLRHGLGYA